MAQEPERPPQTPPAVGEEKEDFEITEKQPADREEAHPFDEELSAEEEPPEERGASPS
ncbi:MAG: hypothetical protein ACRDYA_05050 [Egibacteraceae bacterium]